MRQSYQSQVLTNLESKRRLVEVARQRGFVDVEGHLLNKLYERSSVVITTNLSFSEWADVFGDAKMTSAMRCA